MNQSFAQEINRAKTLLDGLTAYGDDVTQLGITKELVAQLTDLYTRANQLEQKRNDLKANSREATTSQAQIMSKLKNQSSLARKSIRVSLPEEKWLSFGFRAGQYAEKESPDSPGTN